MWSRIPGIVAVAALSSCSFTADYGDAKNATAVFHRLFDRGEYAAIYDTSANAFKEAGTRDQLIGFLKRVNRKMGKCAEATVSFSGYQVTTSGTFVGTTASRTCANGTLSEQFSWLMVSGHATLLKYNADNPILLTD